MIRVCFHGAESTGKSVLIAKLAAELGAPFVVEYGREWAERHGTDFTMDSLLEIAAGQDAAMQAAAASNPPLLLLDTDPLMTAAWAEMLFGEVPDRLMTYPRADHYLLFAADTPWIEDGTRLFGSAAERARFAATCEEVLHRARVRFTPISGDWTTRNAAARQCLAQLAAGSDA